MKKLDSSSFDDWLRGQLPFNAACPQLDLRGYEFMTPAALVQLSSLIYSLANSGVRPSVTLDDAQLMSYLVRAGFCSVVAPVADITTPRNASIYNRPRGSNPMLLEVTCIESCAPLPNLLDSIFWVLRSRLKYPKTDAYDVATIISEIGQNMFDHNRKTRGFLAMQVYPTSVPFLEIGIADHGQGLAETLRKNPKHASIISDAEAIDIATVLGTSQHDDPTRGTGLFHLVEKTHKHLGTLQIRSGQAKVRYRMDKKQVLSFHVAPLAGVQIALNLPTKEAA